ncbi:uncharacterized protein [Haliotis cracherodii]|uniref:uncharacterized protein n=1 Tax=Haliotis cracherodii TaxID=6455 RepID=UPI0039E9FD84
MYGRSCDQICSRNCMEGQCHNRSGMECSIGCRAGFWGKYCERPCGGACLRCNRSSGSCMNCTKGTYGRHCERNCSVNCLERKCNISGTCVSGCTSSYHGNNCSFRCSKHCSTCDQKSGTCNRCVPGWTGENCKESTRTAVFHTLMTVLMMAVGFLVCYLIYASVCYITRQVRENEEGQLLQCCLKWLSKRRTFTSADSFDPINKEFGVNSDFYHGSKRLTLYDEKNNILPCLTQKEFLALDKSSNQGYSVKPYTLNNDTNTSHHHPCVTKGRTVSQCRLDHQQRSQGQQREHMAISKEGRDRSSTSDGRDVSDQSRSSVGCSRTGQNYEDARYANVNHIRRKDSDKSISIPRFSVYCDHQRGASETYRLPGGLQLVRDDCKNETFEGEAKTPACGGKVGMGTPRLETTAVDCRYFMEYLHGMRLHDGFIQQFEELPKGELAMCLDAKRPVNLSQNRFKNMHPYDHCRVILRNSDRASDYINASHINGYGKSGFFIATQGPLQETTADFWNMVLQYEVTAIIMLTNIFENDRLKCVKYWPDVGAARQYGGCCVQTVQEESEMDYTVRTVSIAQGGGHGHQICQYHFTAWPDHGQPSSSHSLLDFYNHAKTTFGDGPIIVHCSAGIGRTGTFIALDYLIDQAIAEGVVDVFQCVKRLRYQRMDMVQTLGQYEFLHEVLGLAFLQLSMDYHNC